MASLLIVGNTNPYTFVNAILAAQLEAQANDGVGLTDIFVLHSKESAATLGANTDWQTALGSFPELAVSPEVFTSVTVDLSTGHAKPLSIVARHVERFLRSLKHHDEVYVDLTNGTSHYKSVLSNVAFVIGARRPYFVNIALVDAQYQRNYWPPEQLRKAYVPLPDPSLLDSLAPAWLTEIRRFNVKSERAAETFNRLSGDPDGRQHIGFRDDIRNAIDAWFKGEADDDSAALDGAVRYIGMAFESMIRTTYSSLFHERSARHKTTHDMLAQIRDHLAGLTTEYDPELLEDASQLLKRLRNASSHERHASEFARVRARLATELLLAVTELFGILHQRGLLSPNARKALGTNTTPCGIEGRPGDTYFFGFDGDDTGRELERLFQGNFDPSVFTRFSQSIDNAMKAVAKQLKKPPIHGELLFNSGDDLLFMGRYDANAINALRTLYNKRSGGQTCSVGFGRTPKEAYIALKMAKANPGKDTVMGVEVINLSSK